VLWLLTIVGWWWSSRAAPRKPRERREAKEPPVHKQQSQLLKKAQKAAVAGDGAGVRAAILDWGRLQWPHDAPRSIGNFAQRVEAPLSDELWKLSSASYGPERHEFDGAALARALKSVTVVAAHVPTGTEEALPPLMPG